MLSEGALGWITRCQNREYWQPNFYRRLKELIVFFFFPLQHLLFVFSSAVLESGRQGLCKMLQKVMLRHPFQKESLRLGEDILLVEPCLSPTLHDASSCRTTCVSDILGLQRARHFCSNNSLTEVYAAEPAPQWRCTELYLLYWQQRKLTFQKLRCITFKHDSCLVPVKVQFSIHVCPRRQVS